jgi:putative nucleotidyltransferase with HDIG domain
MKFSDYAGKLAEMENSFIEYADSFLTDEPLFSRNIILKREHSLRVRRECAEIVKSLEISEHDRFIAEAAGLFHDIGRFEQYTRHRTFVDLKSEDHGQLGIAALRKLNFLDGFDAADAGHILTAVSCHNRRAIPEEISGRELLISKVVRDADKLDIMNIVLNYYRHPETNGAVTLDLEDSPAVSMPIIRSVSRCETVAMRDLRTVTDFKIAQLGWVYDLNFPHSFQIYLERDYHHELLKHLPENSEISGLFETIDRYILAKAAE